MRALQAERIHRRDVKLCEDIQEQNCRGALSVRRMLDKLYILVRAADGLGFFTTCRREVVQSMQTTCGAQRVDHVFCNFARIKGAGAVFCDPAQYLGLSRCTEKIAGFESFAFVEKRLACRALQVVGVIFPVKRHAGRNGDALIGIVDRRCKQTIQPQFTSCFRQMGKGRDCSWDGDGMGIEDGHRFFTHVSQHRCVQRSRGAAGSIHRENVLAVAL